MPISRRPLDLLLAIFFSCSVAYGFLFSLPEGIGVPVSADSPWPPLRWLYQWAVAQEPAHLDPPVSLTTSALLDGFVHSPFLCFLVYALVKERAWIRIPAFLFAGSSVTNMFYYLTQTFLGPHPPPDTAVYLAFNLPWLIAPVVLAWRMRLPDPFRATRGAGA